MGKVIGSAIAGYVVTFIMVFVLLTVSWQIVGIDGAFQPGVWDVTGLWLVLMLVSALVAGIAGGYVTALITADPRGVKWLLGIVVVLGIVSAIPVLMGMGPDAPLPRPDDLAMFDAMQNGKQPAWVALLNPVFGVAGVLLGARLRSGK